MNPPAEKPSAEPVLIEASKRAVLRLICWLLVAGPLAFLFALFIVLPAQPLQAIGPLLILCLAGLCLFLIRLRQETAAARLLVYGGWAAIATHTLVSGGGLHTPQLAAMPLGIMLAGWLLGRRHAIAATLLVVLFTLVLAVLGQTGSPQLLPPLLVWLPRAVVAVGVCLLTLYIVGTYEERIAEVKRLGEFLAEERTQLRRIAENVPALIFHGDRGMRCLFANRQFADFFHGGGVPLEGMHLRQILGDEVFESALPNLDRVLAGESVLLEGERHSRSSGQRNLEISLVPERGAEGEVVGFYALKRDVTERLRAENALAERDAQLRLIVDNVPAMIAYNDTDFVLRYANRRYLDFFGLDPERDFDRPIRDIIGAEAFEQAQPLLRKALEGEKMRYRGQRRNAAGELRTLEVETVADRDPEGRVRGAYALMRDVSDLQLAEEKFAKIFHASPLPATISRVDNGQFIDANPAAALFSGWSREELIGRTSVDLNLWPDSRDRERALQTLRSNGSLRDLDVTYRIRSGELRSTLISAEILDLDGTPCILTLIHDITERKQAAEDVRRLNEELEDRVRFRTADLTAANRELESFAYSISHDLRAPLRGIDGFSHLLAEEYGERLDETGHGYLDRVRRAAQRMGNLIDDILELSRVSRQEMRRVPVDLSQLAAELLEERARAEPGHPVRISIAQGCSATGDPQLLRVLMQNLLENAWKYSAKNPAPHIEFGCQRDKGETVFFVRDNGVGFDMKYAERLFSPFQRLHSPEEFEGTGIGLATVSRIASRHGGRVWAEAKTGKGAILRFTLQEQVSGKYSA